ncbi:hypothetical protein E4U46_005895 [Claviceps purpurea]|nr:hypothetical protein E4U28_000867 [Claviceps purpurea]KAG6285398.1 hypothetical protein E4U46_005895 [Claviceps purpurea]
MSFSFAEITDTPVEVLNDIYRNTTTTRAAVSRLFDGLSPLPKPYGPPIEALAPPRKGFACAEADCARGVTAGYCRHQALDITGRNRPLDADHVTDLKNVFRRDGLERMAPGNRLLCLCTAADIQFGDTTWSNEQSKDIRHWSEAIFSPIEVLAGQHRIAALRDYVTETESDPAELWWTCELYDRACGTIAPIPQCPSHAQVWPQLVDIISRQQDEKVSDSDAVNSDQDPLVNVGDPVLDALRLGNSEIKFPTRQLVTLWNNRPWRRVITQWCRTRLGTSSPSDWDQLAAAFGTRGGDRTSDALSIFYDASGGTRMRNRGLLTPLGHAEYYAFYQHMMKADQLDFPSPHRITRSQIQIMTQVLHHVIAWIDPEMIAILPQQSHGPQSKPLIRTYLQDALRNLARSKGFSNFAVSDKQAVHMQKTILDFAREQTTKFDSCPICLTFFTGDSAPYLTTSDYTTRFAYGVWTRLLDLTRDQLAIAIGSPALTFHQEWDSMVVPTVIPAEATSLPTPTLVELPYLLTRIVTNARDQGCFEGVAGSTARTKIIHTLQEAIDDLQKDMSSRGSYEGVESTTAAKFTAMPLREFPTRMRPEDERRISARAAETRTTSTPMKKALPSSTGADTVETETDLIAWYIGGLEHKLSCQ